MNFLTRLPTAQAAILTLVTQVFTVLTLLGVNVPAAMPAEAAKVLSVALIVIQLVVTSRLHRATPPAPAGAAAKPTSGMLVLLVLLPMMLTGCGQPVLKTALDVRQFACDHIAAQKRGEIAAANPGVSIEDALQLFRLQCMIHFGKAEAAALQSVGVSQP